MRESPLLPRAGRRSSARVGKTSGCVPANLWPQQRGVLLENTRGKTTQPTHKWAHLYAFNWQHLTEDGSEHRGWSQRDTCAFRLSSEHQYPARVEATPSFLPVVSSSNLVWSFPPLLVLPVSPPSWSPSRVSPASPSLCCPGYYCLLLVCTPGS